MRGAWDRQHVGLLAKLLVRGSLLGAWYSVGPWRSAVPSEFTWAVLQRDGSPAWLGHGPYEAGRAWHALETGAWDLSQFDPADLPICDISDAQAWALERAEFWAQHPGLRVELDQWLDSLRTPRPAERTPILASCPDAAHRELKSSAAALRAGAVYRGYQPVPGAPGLHLWN